MIRSLRPDHGQSRESLNQIVVVQIFIRGMCQMFCFMAANNHMLWRFSGRAVSFVFQCFGFGIQCQIGGGHYHSGLDDNDLFCIHLSKARHLFDREPGSGGLCSVQGVERFGDSSKKYWLGEIGKKSGYHLKEILMWF